MSSIFNISNNKINICIKCKDFQSAGVKITIFNNIKEIEECKKEISFSLSPNLIKNVLINFREHDYDNIVEKVFKEAYTFFNEFSILWVQYEICIEFEINENEIYWKNANNVIFFDRNKNSIISLLNKSYYELIFRSEETNKYLKDFVKQIRRELGTCRFYYCTHRYNYNDVIEHINFTLFDMKFKKPPIEFHNLSKIKQSKIVAYLTVLNDSNQYKYYLYRDRRKFKSTVEWIHETNKKLSISIHYMCIENELVVMVPVIE